MANDAASELNDRDQKNLLCAACAEGEHDECDQLDCACRECQEESEARAERAQQREIEDYYGGDGIGSYGPSDPKGW